MCNPNSLIEAYFLQRKPNSRYASFDYCYDYFRSMSGNSHIISLEQNKQTSCLQLMSYLASWGMLRASSRLLREKSMRHFVPVVDLIGSGDLDALWTIDCDSYSVSNIDLLIEAYKRIADLVADNDQHTLTLVTKIMMGVFGCCPAFDTRATDTLRMLYGKNSGSVASCGFRSFNSNALNFVKECYNANQSVVDKWANEIKTLDFDTTNDTDRRYTKAKVLDMLLFQAKGTPFTP